METQLQYDTLVSQSLLVLPPAGIYLEDQQQEEDGCVEREEGGMQKWKTDLARVTQFSSQAYSFQRRLHVP